ncbi:MAG TPA: EAL domain-containing protein [Burkholderiaceae bacterium]|nr:EAL domain-containing protein [Burkholderiaceae bacterium]
MANSRNRFITLVTVSYTVLALAWIFLSDQMLLNVLNVRDAAWLSTAKGVFFVVSTAVGYFLALRAVAGDEGGQQPLLAMMATGLAPTRGSGPLCYVLAAALSGATLFARLHMEVVGQHHPLLILFVLPVILSAMLGGLGPGLLATAVATVGDKLLAIEPLYSMRFERGMDLLVWSMLVLNGVVVSVLSEVLRRALHRRDVDRNLLTSVVGGTSDAIYVKDLQGRYLLANGAAAGYLGRSQADMLGRDDLAMLPVDAALAITKLDREIIASGRTQTQEEFLVNPAGERILFQSTKGPIYDSSGAVVGLFGVSRDITKSKLAEERIQYLAHYDVLTGLPNRVQLDDRIQHAIGQAADGGQKLALLFLDLDHFKDINDSLGHSVGDALLVALARRLRAIMRADDMVARLGGDEFVFLLQGVDVAGLAQTAQRILDVVEETFSIEQHELTVSGSIGIALYPDDSGDLEGLVKCADAAMYRAKQNGRNRYCFFTAEIEALTVRRMQVVSALRHALEQHQLTIHYQPQFSARDGRIIGAEALLRWHHPLLGQVSPEEFIPAAEDSGLIVPIGEWVLRRAVRQMKAWLDEGMAPFVLAVNLSTVQFRHPNLPAMVATILAEEQLPPQYLELELTESGAMHDPPAAIAVMDQLHEHGVRMAIDDFGIAYSSLSYLKKFKVYKLKIDQSFVRDISADPEDRAIVTAIIAMARGLGLRTIAEGVETQAQLDFLREHGCDEIQGYYYSKPLSAEQFGHFVHEVEPCAA